jgi:hypothetical protein
MMRLVDFCVIFTSLYFLHDLQVQVDRLEKVAVI